MQIEEKNTKGLTDINEVNIIENKDKEDIFDCTESNIDKRAKKRGRWFTMILYPDNSYHMHFLTYVNGSLREVHKDFQAFWIYHTKEEGEKKNHFHLQLYFANERTINGVCKMLGVGNYFTTDGKNYKAIFDKTGFPEEIKIEEKANMSLSLCSVVSDIHSYYQYLMHKDYASYLKGKRVYKESDFRFTNYDYSLMSYVRECKDKKLETGGELIQIQHYVKEYHCTHMRILIDTLIANNELQLIKYVEKNAYFVNMYMKGGKLF